jgi:hypothetical protein
MRFTQSNPGTRLEIRQIHNKRQAVENKVYWGKAEDGSIHKYRGTHEGRLKEEEALIQAEIDIDKNTTEIVSNDVELADHESRIADMEKNKADKCYALAMAIIL